MHKLTLQIISLFFITSLGAAEMTSSGISQKEVRFSIYEPSDIGKQQMVDIVQFAKKNYYGGQDEPVNLLERIWRYLNGNRKKTGRCYKYVWRYLYETDYGNIQEFDDLPNMGYKYARDFSDYLNASQDHLDEAGLVRIDNTNQKITNPHDPRIPDGAIIVVAPGSYGTAHPKAGDIVVKAGNRHFINDQYKMDYGTSSIWFGEVLGVYVPK